jgi:O-antigen ligase
VSVVAFAPPELTLAPGRFQRGFVFVALLFSAVAVIPWLRSSPADVLYPTEGGLPTLLVWAGLYGVAILALVAHPRTLLDTPVNGKVVWALVALAASSALWSEVPAVTLRQAGELALTTAFAYYLATRLETRDVVRLLSWGLLAVGVACAAVAVALPELGRDHLRDEAWSGLFTTKNELGRVMALAAVVWIVRYVTREGNRLACGLATVFSVALVALSESKTALIVLLAISLLIPAILFLRSRPQLVAPLLTALLAAGAGLAYWLESASGFLHRFTDPGLLTGRAELWEEVWAMIQPHLWLGHGYAAFWRGVEGPSALVWSATGFQAPHAHNGFLDAWLALGVVGFVLALAAIGIGLRRAFGLLTSADGVGALWPAVFVPFLVLYNVTESTFLTANSLFWILFCVVLLRPPRETGQRGGARLNYATARAAAPRSAA